MKTKLGPFLVKTLTILFIINLSVTTFFCLLFKQKKDKAYHTRELTSALEFYFSSEVRFNNEKINNTILNFSDFHDLGLIKKYSGADFVKIVNEKLTVQKNYSDITGYSLLNYDYIGSLIAEAKSPVSTFIYLPLDFLNKGLLNLSVKRDELTYLHIIPFVHRGEKRFLIIGYLISEERKSLFSQGLLIADSLSLVNKNGEIINLHGQVLPEKIFSNKNVNNIDILKLDQQKFLVVSKSINDIRGAKVSSLIVLKKLPSLLDYTKDVLPWSFMYSILIVSLFGLFITMHYKKANMFLTDLENTFKNFVKGEFKVQRSFDRLKEFSKFYNILEEGVNLISARFKALTEEISLRTKEIIEINKALVILSKSKDIESLIRRSEVFLREDLGLKTIDIERCDEVLKKCDKCRLKKIRGVVNDKEYGFCVDLEEKDKDFINDFLDIFQELFANNLSRIGHSLRINETNLEYVQLSEILMSLMAKKNTNEIFNLILEKAKEICKADASYIGVYDRATDFIALKFFINIMTDEFKNLRFKKDQGLGGLVLREKRGIFVKNYFTDHRIDAPFKDIVRKEGVISTIAVPIFYQEDVFGILYVGYRTVKNDITFELSFLQKLASAAAIAIERENYITELKNKELELRKAYDEIVERRKEINELLKGYKEANLELERSNRGLMEQYEIVKKSYEELNNLNKAKDLFLGILSHELKTPITIVKGYLETLLTKDFSLSESVRKALTTTLKSVNNLSEKVDDLLDYMRLETKKLKLATKELSLNKLLSEIIEELTPFLEERKQKINLKNEDISIKGDPKWLKKAFMAIVNNSIKFSPDNKKIFIDFDVVDREKLVIPNYVTEKLPWASKYLVIAVKDEGIGIPEEEINKIFDTFYELGDIKTHSTGKYKFMSKGIGLGLSFAKKIISLHNGIVYAESPGFDVEKCPGTTIKVILPFDGVMESKEEKKDVIVIIDSDYEFSRFLELFLSQKYSVYLFDDGGVGYLKVLEIKPQLVMINVSLKNYDGYEVCSIIKEDKNIKDVPVILYGTGPESFDEVRAQRVKANMIFYPIFDTENLLRIVDYYLKNSSKK